MTKKNYTHFRLSDEELTKLDIACEFHELNRTDMLRRMIEKAYRGVVRKEKENGSIRQKA